MLFFPRVKGPLTDLFKPLLGKIYLFYFWLFQNYFVCFNFSMISKTSDGAHIRSLEKITLQDRAKLLYAQRLEEVSRVQRVQAV